MEQDWELTFEIASTEDCFQRQQRVLNEEVVVNSK
jgi:hypothetical protein